MQPCAENAQAQSIRNNTAPVTVSILMPTHNRCAILLRALDSLRAIHVPKDLRVDLVIVANGCTDDTVAQIEKVAPTMPFPTRYVSEQRLGLSHARNRAIAEASGEILAFLDDDISVDRAWLTGLLDVFTHQPADIVVGPVALWWDAVAKPVWLGAPAERLLSCINHGTHVMELHQPGLGIGANLAMRREVARTVGLFQAGLGRTGQRIIGGEDTDFLVRALHLKKRMFYSPTASVRHWVDPERIQLAYLHRCAYGIGLARPFLRPTLSRAGALWMSAKYAARSAVYGVLECLARAAQPRGAWINHHIRRMTCWGSAVGAWRCMRRQACGGAHPEGPALTGPMP